MTEQERQELAESLAGMTYRKARTYIKRNFTDARLKTFRNGVNQDEIHTMYELPEHNLQIVLVESKAHKPIRRALATENEGGGGPYAKFKVNYFFTEARVIDWMPPAHY